MVIQQTAKSVRNIINCAANRIEIKKQKTSKNKVLSTMKIHGK